MADASAILAVLFDEHGADASEQGISDGAAMSAINVAEVLTRLVDFGADLDDAWEAFASLPITVIDADANLAVEMARLRPITRAAGLSLGDRACLALGRLRGEPVLTADRRWATLDLGVEVRLIR